MYACGAHTNAAACRQLVRIINTTISFVHAYTTHTRNQFMSGLKVSKEHRARERGRERERNMKKKKEPPSLWALTIFYIIVLQCTCALSILLDGWANKQACVYGSAEQYIYVCFIGIYNAQRPAQTATKNTFRIPFIPFDQDPMIELRCFLTVYFWVENNINEC